MHLVLHIGMEKTGTTLLQRWLYHNLQQLSLQRIFLSDVLNDGFANRKLVSFFLPGLDDFCRTRRIKTREEKESYFQGFKGKLRDEIKLAERGHDVMIITSEHFHSQMTSPNDMQKLKDFLSGIFSAVTVVCYIREQSDVRKSLYSTALRHAYSGGIEEFQNPLEASRLRYYDYYSLASRWSSFFGKENMDLRVYDRARFVNRDLRADFLTAIPLVVNEAKLSFDIDSANEQLDYITARAYSTINRLVPYWNEDGERSAINMLLKRHVSSLQPLR